MMAVFPNSKVCMAVTQCCFRLRILQDNQVESLILVSEKVLQSFMKAGNAFIRMSVFEFEWGQIDAQTYTVPNRVLKKQLNRSKLL